MDVLLAFLAITILVFAVLLAIKELTERGEVVGPFVRHLLTAGAIAWAIYYLIHNQ